MKTHVVVHHSLTKDSGTVSWGAIRKYHMDPTGPYKMKDVGYHFGIELIDDVHEMLIGRMANDGPAAHCKEMNMNTRAYGICLIGNFDLVQPPTAQLVKAVRLIRYLMQLDGIPATNVVGHREVGMMAGYDWTKGQYKSCPGKLFDMGAFRATL